MFGKIVMKNAHLPKINILFQFGGEMFAPFCSNMTPYKSFQMNFVSVLSQDKIRKICMESLEHKSATSHLQIEMKCWLDFWQVNIFHHDLSEYLSNAHNRDVINFELCYAAVTKLLTSLGTIIFEWITNKNYYLKVPQNREATNTPGTPWNLPRTSITKYGKICRKTVSGLLRVQI